MGCATIMDGRKAGKDEHGATEFIKAEPCGSVSHEYAWPIPRKSRKLSVNEWTLVHSSERGNKVRLQVEDDHIFRRANKAW